MLAQHKYNYPQISKCLRRTEVAVKKHIEDLGWQERPVKTEAHVIWSEEEVNILIRMKNLGYGNNTVGDQLGRTARAVERKLGTIAKDPAYKYKLAEHLRRGENDNGGKKTDN
jgi:hypothetical protein